MPSLVTVVLMEFERQFQAEPELQGFAASLINEIIEFALAQWEDTLRDGAVHGPAMTLAKVIDAFGDHIFRRPDLASVSPLCVFVPPPTHPLCPLSGPMI